MIEEQQQTAESSSDSAVEAVTGAAAPALEPTAVPVPADDLPGRPDGVPEKFWDAEMGAVRTDALLKSYTELERKLGSMVALPNGDDDQEGRQRLQRALGVPDSPEDYGVEVVDELLGPNDALNATLHEAGFTKTQAQLVYDLAAAHVLPLIDDTVGEMQAARDRERLAAHFGGEDGWLQQADQIKTWGEANLAPEVFETLASSFDGVLAMRQMMAAPEPAVIGDAESSRGGVDRDALRQMMRDPRYWRDRDPAFIAEVTEGFKRVYEAG